MLHPSATAPGSAQPSLTGTLVGPLPARGELARQYDIDAARGIAIILVVTGHVVSRENPPGNEWYPILKDLIYRFHMPLFMVLSGITFALSLPRFSDARSIADYSRRRLGRLAVPYLFFGMLILIGKLVAARFMHVDNLPQGSIADVVALIFRPSHSAAGFLWFIYVLGLYFAILPGVLHVMGRRPLALFVGALLLQAVSWPEEFALDQAVGYLPYFCAGMLLWMCRDRWRRMTLTMALGSIILFSIALAFALPFGLSKWLVGALSVPAILGLCQRLSLPMQQRLAWVGLLSLSIYLMNTLAIGLSKALMLKLFSWDGPNFLVYFPVLLIAGVALPIRIKRLVTRYAPWADRYV